MWENIGEKPGSSGSSGKRKSGSQRECHFKNEWKTKYHIIDSCPVNTAFYCIPCNRQLSCAHQGEKDVTRHISSDGHKKFANDLLNQRTIQTTLHAVNRNAAVIRAECIMTNFIVQHNLPFST